MQRVEIDCQSREVKIFALSTEEEAEQQARQQKIALEEKKITKRLLVKLLGELREMEQNMDIFNDDDLAEKEAEIAKLKKSL